jgi:hypothetical protein
MKSLHMGDSVSTVRKMLNGAPNGFIQHIDTSFDSNLFAFFTHGVLRVAFKQANCLSTPPKKCVILGKCHFPKEYLFS